ncbi:hypothetical protein EVAR_52353_1 [Eumeta japonica]|uniref:Uncharacterized protein n=1 Tax=Eumeta variegata TaxID=151549 RepID=A0A4C1YUG8_EUMVA|nr:hypothetical protein EVAR_52353_1 [Eumeta japonica]
MTVRRLTDRSGSRSRSRIEPVPFIRKHRIAHVRFRTHEEDRVIFDGDDPEAEVTTVIARAHVAAGRSAGRAGWPHGGRGARVLACRVLYLSCPAPRSPT